MTSISQTADPLEVAALLWPNVQFYDKQREVIYSVRDNDETYVPAGNMLGKDFVAAFIILWFFLTRTPCRVVTTSAKEDHLRVLWGEIANFIDTAKYGLTVDSGGPLTLIYREIRYSMDGKIVPLSYIRGMVASGDTLAAMQGHHIARIGDGIPRTLFVADECSNVPDQYYTMAKTWANRILAIGNPWPCDNFFKYAVKGRPGTKDRGGDIKAESNSHYFRKVIRITAEDSPNVRYSKAEIRKGLSPSNRILVPGVKPYDEYLKNRKLWNPLEQSVGLDAEFYEGAEVMLFPSSWLNAAEMVQIQEKQGERCTLGVDSAMGGDMTAWAVCSENGLIDLVSRKTPDTSIIPDWTLSIMRKYEIQAEDVLFDSGGGGKVHADRLRRQGYNVRTVAFGESVTPETRRRKVTPHKQAHHKEERYVYVNRRAQMYGMLRLKLEPQQVGEELIGGFGLPCQLLDRVRLDGGPSLRQQLLPIPLQYDEEGRMYVPSKKRKAGAKKDSNKPTLDELIGCSPDESDALVLAVYGLESRKSRSVVGAIRVS